MDFRIATTQAHAKVLDELTSQVGGEQYALFETKQKALMFAAALGFHLPRREQLTNRDSSAAIRFEIFEKNQDDGFMACLGIATLKDLSLLSEGRRAELISIFEEYANGGLCELQLQVLGRAAPLQALLRLMEDARHPQKEEGLEGVDSNVLATLLGR